MKKARRLGEIKKKKQIANTKVFNTKAKQYNKNDLEAEEERAKRTMRQSLGIMGELEDQYDRDKKSYSDSKYSTFIQREQNDLLLAKMISNDNRNRAQRDAMIDTMNKSQVR